MDVDQLAKMSITKLHSSAILLTVQNTQQKKKKTLKQKGYLPGFFPSQESTLLLFNSISFQSLTIDARTHKYV